MTVPNKVSLERLGLFSGAPQHETFPRLKDLLPTGKLSPAINPYYFPNGASIKFPDTYNFNGKEKASDSFFEATDTAALLVLKDGEVRYERYALTGGQNVHWISWSVAKSFISALVGIAVDEGHIRSIEDPISNYITVSPNSAYDGVSIKDVLQMSSGARWSEAYNDPDSEIHRLGAAMGGASTLDKFVAEMVRESEPGTVCRYNSGDTQALGSLLVHATKRSITDYMQEKLFGPLGMTSDGYWLLDSAGMEMAFAGLNLTAQDFAKLGELYRNGGVWQGQQIVPAEWVKKSITPDRPHLVSGQPILADHKLPLGYGYQWWIPDGASGEFSAIGIYNQFVYVDPSRGVVIVKLSSNRAYGTTMTEETNREIENIAFLRAIAAQFD
ncbi:serine hydrolase [Pseudomonas ogarae]|uniref:serine hydrolase domain-containing protein n=1 Tax=Pseudomonas ogarae (strain DSM 112162 / CECT 30235 / F113) TaxID=1114970 RepID=UPI0009A45680|nr:serine hydrolase [Pseudomonas ogarae]OPG72115.1 serine hydrolase [Pseudomonas ogarae]